MPGRRSRVAVDAFALAMVAAVAAILSVGCGSAQQSAAPLASPSAVKAVAFSSPQGGFVVKYPANFVEIEPSSGGSADPSLIYQVFLADPTGAKRSDSALDVLGVTVRRMSRAARPGDLRRFKTQFEGMAGELIGRPAGLRLAAPFTLTNLGGSPALTATYVYKVGGVDVASVVYLVPHGKRVYWLTGQASQGTWATSGRVIGASLATFSIRR